MSSSSASPFFRNVLTLVTGTAFAQIITILCSPIITRLYGPEAFGLLAIFTSISGIFAIIVCLRYEFAIVLPKSDNEAANVFGLCLLFMLLISLLSIPILILSQKLIEQLLKAPLLGQVIWIIPPSISLSGAFFALNYWNTRKKQFSRVAIAQVMRTCSSTGTQLAMGFMGHTTGGILIGASVIGQLVSTCALGMQIMRNDLSFFKQNITLKGMIKELKHYSNFPKYDIWSALLNNFAVSCPVFILAIYFDSKILGYYSIALMVLFLPVSLIGSSIAQVFFQEAAEAKNISQIKLKETVENTLKPLIFFAFFPTLLLMLIGPELFGAVFGFGWQESGIFARYLSLWIFIVFIAYPMSSLFVIFQKQKFMLFFNFADLIFRIIALLIGAVIIGNVVSAIILFALAGCITNVIVLVYLFRLSNVPLLKPLSLCFKYFLFSIPFLIIIEFIQYFSFIKDLGLVIFSFILIIIYYLLAIKNDPEMFNSFKKIISQVPIIKKYFD